MRNAERVRAYQMRVSGMTWEAIGRAMHYDGQTIKRDLINSLPFASLPCAESAPTSLTDLQRRWRCGLVCRNPPSAIK